MMRPTHRNLGNPRDPEVSHPHGRPQYGQVAVSALGSGRACPATVIGRGGRGGLDTHPPKISKTPTHPQPLTQSRRPPTKQIPDAIDYVHQVKVQCIHTQMSRTGRAVLQTDKKKLQASGACAPIRILLGQQTRRFHSGRYPNRPHHILVLVAGGLQREEGSP